MKSGGTEAEAQAKAKQLRLDAAIADLRRTIHATISRDGERQKSDTEDVQQKNPNGRDSSKDSSASP